MAGVEIGVVLGQCLNQRIPDMATVRLKVSGWERRRNMAKAMVNWRFTTTKAREKLKRLYPT
jgi:hypothetical protein